jgi:hypothetical protein
MDVGVSVMPREGSKAKAPGVLAVPRGEILHRCVDGPFEERICRQKKETPREAEDGGRSELGVQVVDLEGRIFFGGGAVDFFDMSEDKDSTLTLVLILTFLLRYLVVVIVLERKGAHRSPKHTSGLDPGNKKDTLVGGPRGFSNVPLLVVICQNHGVEAQKLCGFGDLLDLAVGVVREVGVYMKGCPVFAESVSHGGRLPCGRRVWRAAEWEKCAACETKVERRTEKGRPHERYPSGFAPARRFVSFAPPVVWGRVSVRRKQAKRL